MNTIKLKDFELKTILFNNASKKLVCLLGKFKNSETDEGIVMIEKVEFTESSLATQEAAESILQHIQLKTPVINDVYGNFSAETDTKFNREFILNKFRSSLLFLTSTCRTQGVNHLSGNREAHQQVCSPRSSSD